MNIVQKLRGEAGLGLRELSRLADVYPQTLSAIEKGGKAQLKTLGKIANALSTALGRKIPLETFEEFIDDTAAERGRAGGKPTHKKPISEGGQDTGSTNAKAAEIPAIIIPVPYNPAPAPVQAAPQPPVTKPAGRTSRAKIRFDLFDTETARKLAEDLNSNFGQIKYLMLGMDNYKLPYEQLKPLLEERLKRYIDEQQQRKNQSQ